MPAGIPLLNGGIRAFVDKIDGMEEMDDHDLPVLRSSATSHESGLPWMSAEDRPPSNFRSATRGKLVFEEGEGKRKDALRGAMALIGGLVCCLLLVLFRHS